MVTGPQRKHRAMAASAILSVAAASAYSGSCCLDEIWSLHVRKEDFWRAEIASCGSLMATLVAFNKSIKSSHWISAQNQGLLKTTLDAVVMDLGKLLGDSSSL